VDVGKEHFPRRDCFSEHDLLDFMMLLQDSSIAPDGRIIIDVHFLRPSTWEKRVERLEFRQFWQPASRTCTISIVEIATSSFSVHRNVTAAGSNISISSLAFTIPRIYGDI
jgi:hypothetical protein